MYWEVLTTMDIFHYFLRVIGKPHRFYSIIWLILLSLNRFGMRRTRCSLAGWITMLTWMWMQLTRISFSQRQYPMLMRVTEEMTWPSTPSVHRRIFFKEFTNRTTSLTLSATPPASVRATNSVTNKNVNNDCQRTLISQSQYFTFWECNSLNTCRFYYLCCCKLLSYFYYLPISSH